MNIVKYKEHEKTMIIKTYKIKKEIKTYKLYSS